MMKELNFILEVFINIFVLFIFATNIFISSLLDIHDWQILIIVTFHICILFIYSAIIDQIQVLKRLGVSKISFKLNKNVFKELWYLLIYGASLWEGQIGSIDGKSAYTLKRYTNEFYKKSKKEENSQDNQLMIQHKMKRAYSNSCIMKNNLPKNIAEEKICEVWREPGTDIIYYGSLILVNILFYVWYFIIR